MMLSAAALCSCGDDFLEKVPSHQYTAENYYSSDQAVMKAIEPLYGYAWFDYISNAIFMGSLRANDGWNPYNNADFATFQITGLSADVAAAWSSYYMVVSMSNQLINDVEKYCSDAVSEDVKNLAIGEAYLMRGAAYFMLVRSWGDAIVYENNEEMTADPVRPLTKEEDVLKFALRDFERAAELLPAASTNMHATKYAAKAFQAKALLALSGWGKGGTRDTQMLAKVVELCDEVLDYGPYSLMPDFEDLFKYDSNNFSMQNQETVLCLRFGDPLIAEWGNKNALLSTVAWSGSTDVTAWGGIYASPDMLDLYNEEIADSIRIKAAFCLPGAYYSYWDTGNDLVAAADKTPENGYPQPQGFVYNKKHCQVKKGIPGTKADCGGHLAQQGSPLNIYLMRLADVYLTKAEAILGNDATSQNGDGLSALNTLRARVNLPALTSYSLETLIRERRMEFCMEFTNWYDMVTWYRWKPDYMLDYFNNKQNRAFEIREGDVLYNPDRTISYRTFTTRQSTPWYMYTDEIVQGDQRGCYWNDCMRLGDSEDVYMTQADGYVYDLKAMLNELDGFDPVTLKEENIFLPYPEADVIRNPYLKQPAVSYDFGE